MKKIDILEVLESLKDIHNFLDHESSGANCLSFTDEESSKIVLEKLSKLERTIFFQVVLSGAGFTGGLLIGKIKEFKELSEADGKDFLGKDD